MIIIDILLVSIIFYLLYQKQKDELKLQIQNLNNNLANPRSRGSFGEKIVEDVLKSMNFKEGIHYLKQNTSEITGLRPDITLLLTSQLKLNLDSKFPLNNYLKLTESKTELEQKEYKSKFLKDVRARIKEIHNKEYIDPSEGTLDFALIFIPNEQIFQFIIENDLGIYEFCSKEKVVLCSPWSLMGILYVVNSALFNFTLDTNLQLKWRSQEKFEKEWGKYQEEFDRLLKKMQDLNGVVDNLSGIRQRSLRKALEVNNELLS